jgi:FKBP-type peptidyl-prolyl cis-trans isomerase
MNTSPSGLQYEDTVAGSGAEATADCADDPDLLDCEPQVGHQTDAST